MSRQGKTVASCSALCDQTEGCAAFSLLPASGACILVETTITKTVGTGFATFVKSVEAPGASATPVGCFDGVVPPGFEVKCNVRFASQADKIVVKKPHTVASCATLCKLYDNCKLFSLYNGNWCTLSTTLTTKSLPNAHSFVRIEGSVVQGSDQNLEEEGEEQCFEGSLPRGYKVHCGAKFRINADKIYTRKEKTVASCAKLCDNHEKCASFTLSSEGLCYLVKSVAVKSVFDKSLFTSFVKDSAGASLASPAPAPTAGSSCYSGVVPLAYEAVCDTRYKINSEKIMAKNNLDAVECAALCSAKAACKLFTLEPAGKCFLMSTDSTRPMAGYVSFKPSSAPPVVTPTASSSSCFADAIPTGYGAPQCNGRFALYSTKFVQRKVANVQACAALCDSKQPQCLSITFDADKKFCYLSSSAALKGGFDGHIAFVKGGEAPSVEPAPSPAPSPPPSSGTSVSSCFSETIPSGYGAPQCSTRFALYSTKFLQRKVANVQACAVLCDSLQPKCLSLTFIADTGFCYLSTSVDLKSGFDGHVSFVRGAAVPDTTAPPPLSGVGTIQLASFIEIHETKLFDAKPVVVVNFACPNPSGNKIQIKILLGTTLVAVKVKGMTAAEGIMEIPVAVKKAFVPGESYVIQVLIFKATDTPKLATALAKVVQPYVHGDSIMAQEEGYGYGGGGGDNTAETCKAKCDAMRSCLGADLMQSLMDGKGRTCEKSGSIPMACLPNAPHFVNVAFMCDSAHRQVVATVGALEPCYERCDAGCMQACEEDSMGLADAVVCQKLLCM